MNDNDNGNDDESDSGSDSDSDSDNDGDGDRESSSDAVIVSHSDSDNGNENDKESAADQLSNYFFRKNQKQNSNLGIHPPSHLSLQFLSDTWISFKKGFVNMIPQGSINIRVTDLWHYPIQREFILPK